MRGYEKWGKRLVLVDTGKGEYSRVWRTVYERFFSNPPYFLVSYQKLWRQVEYRNGIFYLDMKKENSTSE